MHGDPGDAELVLEAPHLDAADEQDAERRTVAALERNRRDGLRLRPRDRFAHFLSALTDPRDERLQRSGIGGDATRLLRRTGLRRLSRQGIAVIGMTSCCGLVVTTYFIEDKAAAVAIFSLGAFLATFGSGEIQRMLLARWGVSIIELDPVDKARSIDDFLESLL